MNNFVVRALSAALLVFVILTSLFWCELSRYIILSVIGVAACWEFLSLYQNGGVKVARLFTTVGAVAILLSNYLGFNTITILSILFVVRCSWELYRKNEKPLESVSYEVFGLIYTILPMILLYKSELFTIFALFMFVWINDVGAYLVGSTMGKRRLFPRVSPKKSWEGFYGGFFLCIGVAIGWSAAEQENRAIYWISLAALSSISAVFGDLFESLIKRSLSIKDSGKTIPGHGGVLDRFDALLFAALGLYILDSIVEIFG